jgi:ribosomal protein S18 acetylase RimI-like enzyme
MTGPAITVRRAEPRDTAALGRLGALLMAVHYAYDADRFIAPGDGAEALYGGFLASQMDRGDAVVLAAEQEGAVLGYAYGALEGNDWLALRGPAGVVYDLIVDPARRSAGVGRMLLKAMLDALTGLGAPRIVLFTATQNAAAQRLFAAAGFRATMIEMTRERDAPGGEKA